MPAKVSFNISSSLAAKASGLVVRAFMEENMPKPAKKQPLFLGLDSSTQSLKATVIDSVGQTILEAGVNFDSDIPEFETRGGARHHEDGLTVTSPPLMWVAALDLLLQRLRGEKLDVGAIAAVSGSGQQHGSVYLRRGSKKRLCALDAAQPLRRQLSDIFTVEESPIWMDSSTAKQCRERDEAVGGAQAMAELTGSRSY
jgi:xylulokinase